MKQRKYIPQRLTAPERKEERSPGLWAWEFSKRLVLICTAIYAAEQLFAMAAMWHFASFDYLGTMIEQTSDILKTCVFGYLVKAGIENIFKNWGSGPEDAAPPDIT